MRFLLLLVATAAAWSQVKITNNCPLDTGEAGVAYSVLLTASGGQAPYTWFIDQTLPKGMTFTNGNNGTTPSIGGTPQVAITNFAFTLTAQDNNGTSTRTQCSFSIAPALDFTFPSLVDARIHIPYPPPPLPSVSCPCGSICPNPPAQLAYSGGIPPYTYSLASGSLPPGLSLSVDGLISGSPTSTSDTPYPFSVVLQDGKTRITHSAAISVRNAVTITTPRTLPVGVVGQAYNTKLVAELGTPPYTWLIFQGSTPDGLKLDPNTGVITGTPTIPTANNAFCPRVTDSLGATDISAFSILVNQTSLAITAGITLPTAYVGAAYNSPALTATGGIGPYTWSITKGTLPAGLTLNPNTGQIAGTPQPPAAYDSTTRTATYPITVQVKDAQSTTATQDLSIVVRLGPVVTTASLPIATIGKAYNFTLAASQGVQPYTWGLTADSDPLRDVGMDLNPSTGQITGTPFGLPGTKNLKIQVTGQDTATTITPFTLTITNLAMTTNSALPDGFPGEPYTVKLAATGGSGRYTWTQTGTYPPGLSLSSDGTLSGTPTAVNFYNFTATLSDGNVTVPVGFTLSIKLRPIVPAITGVSSSVSPAAQPQMKVSIPNAYAVNIAGTLTMTFQATTQTATDDPSTQFATGARTANFTIPAGQTDALFGNNAFIVLQTGTMAANLTFTATFTAAGAPLIPNASITVNSAIPAQSPVVSSPPTINMNPTTPGADFEVTVTGYSTTREMTDAAFAFTPKSNFNLSGSTVTIANFGAAATSFWASSASANFGGTFTFIQPFKVTGDKTGIGTVTVTLKNTAGTSATATANFP